MKTIKNILIVLVLSLSVFSCIKEENPEFVAYAPDSFLLTNSILNEYILNANAATNIGERFTWDASYFGTQTNISYELQNSFTEDFTEMNVVGETTGNEYAVTITELLALASQLGMDTDPNTEDPNTGTVYYRVRAHAGNSDSDVEVYSDVAALNLFLPEESDDDNPVCEFDQLYLVGAGVPDAGWGWDTPVVLPCTGNGIYSGNVNFSSAVDGNNFRFFTEADNWGSGRNYPWYEDAGYTIDVNFENANDGDLNFAFIGESGTYFLTVDDTNKVITLGPPQATGVCEFDQLWLVGAGVPDAGWGWDTPVQLLCTGDGVYSGNVNFSSAVDGNNFRFFTEADNWGSGRNYPWYVDAGYTIDPNFEDAMDGDNNFAFIGTSGVYFLTVDDTNKVITLE